MADSLSWSSKDVKFALTGAKSVIFPQHNPIEHRQQIYKTQRLATRLTKWAAADMKQVADRALALAEQLTLSDPEIQDLLFAHVASGDDPWVSACNWLKQTSHWIEWLPSETRCVEGQGIVDTLGELVLDEADAVACSVCPVGTFSKKLGQTRICSACPPGQHQSLPGEISCILCELGTIAAEEGMMDCVPCKLGQYANETGMTFCHQCGDPFASQEQLKLWTTSQKVVQDDGEMWIQVQGASDESRCGCVPGAYLTRTQSTPQCEVCGVGALCPGSSELLLRPGHSARSGAQRTGNTGNFKHFRTPMH